jgi:phosphoribosylformylglycinamidine synthase
VRARVYITLKPGVHDPAGSAVRNGLAALGHTDVSDVRIGRFVEIEVPDGPVDRVRARVETMCAELLANPVIEDVRVELP